MFSEISKSFRGLPLKNLKVMMARVRGTRTRTGLQIMCRLDVHEYRTGERVTKEEEAALNIWYDPHDDEIEKHWHYIIDGTAGEAGAEPVKRRTVFEVREELLRERKEKAEAKEAEKKARAEAKKAEKEAQVKNIAAV